MVQSQVLRSAIFVFAFVICTQAGFADTPCSSVAVYKYPKKACTITIDRSVPGSPLPVQVPAGTTVTIAVNNQRKTEILKIITTNDAVASPDILGGITQQIVTPLAALVVHQQNYVAQRGKHHDPLVQRQSKMNDELLRIANDINTANTQVSCLQSYVTWDGKACTLSVISNDSAYEDARSKAEEQVVSASAEALPYQELAKLDTEVDREVKRYCPAPTNTIPDHNQEICNELVGNQKRLDDNVKALQDAQKALADLQPVLKAVKSIPPTTVPPISNAANLKAAIRISAQEQIGKTSIDIATVVITWQQTNWSLSMGVVLSSLANQSFANSPHFVNGVPVKDANGNITTTVTRAQSYPGIISPVFLVSYRLHNFQRDSGRWALLVSGGLGANIVSKSADFAFGPSLQYGSVIFTPAVHYGRQTELTSGVQVNDQLGSSPPSLPTNNPYKFGYGLAVTYRLPLP